jgi:hypothetical protein
MRSNSFSAAIAWQTGFRERRHGYPCPQLELCAMTGKTSMTLVEMTL